jgi:two-component system, OmpR family, sensor histidine kinase ArlS
MFSIKSKIIITYTLIFGIVLVSFAFIVYRTIETNFYEKISSNLRNYSRLVHNEIVEEIEHENQIDIKKVRLLKGAGLYDVKTQVFDTCGKIIFVDSTIFSNQEEFSKIASQKRFNLQVVDINNHSYMSLWKPIRIDHKIEGILHISASLHEVDSNLSTLLLVFFILIPVSLVTTAVIAYFVSKASFKPIINMAKTANEITINNLNTRLELPKPNDEVKSLGTTLNNMISRIESSVKSQRQFIANASHEFRTPLTIIQTELELSEKKLKSFSDSHADSGNNNDEEALNFLSDSLKIVLTEIESLNKFTNDLLIITKLDSAQNVMRVQTFRIDELILECIQNMKMPAERKNIKIILLENEPNEISADRDKIKSVFLNLIDNAIKYTGQSYGNIHKEIFVESKQTADSITISVEDSGIGISSSDLPDIFNRFFRSNEIRSQEPGNGLGLSIVKDFVEMHNGSIKVESVLEKGTKFTIKLPT